LSKQDRDYEVENVCIKHIRKLSKSILPTERILILEKMNEELEPLLLEQNERVVLEFFNITAWVASKINKTSYSEAVQRELRVTKN
jgi:hypothetical protein